MMVYETGEVADEVCVLEVSGNLDGCYPMAVWRQRKFTTLRRDSHLRLLATLGCALPIS